MKSEKYYSYLYSSEKVIAFERRLNEIGIKINADSDLYRIGFDVLDVYEKHKDLSLHDNNEDIRESMSSVLGFNNFIEKVFPLINSEYIDRFKPHLELLNESSIPQTTKSKVTDQGSNKLFELYVASLCYPQFQNIRLDSPNNSKGDNPDVMFDFNGVSWSIACKVVHSSKTKSIYDNIEKAIDQIERSNSCSGFVFLNIKNIIDYDSFWPILNKEEFQQGVAEPLFSSYTSVDTPVKILQNHVLKIKNNLIEEFGTESIVKLFKNKKAQPVIVVLIQAATGMMVNGHPVTTLLCFLGMIEVVKLEDQVVDILDKINDGLR